MPAPIRVLLLLLLLLLLLCESGGAARVRKKATRARPCMDLPEEILEQMFGRLSVGVLSAFHHALQLEPLDKLNLSCPNTARPSADSKARLPANLLSISPWAYRCLQSSIISTLCIFTPLYSRVLCTFDCTVIRWLSEPT